MHETLLVRKKSKRSYRYVRRLFFDPHPSNRRTLMLTWAQKCRLVLDNKRIARSLRTSRTRSNSILKGTFQLRLQWLMRGSQSGCHTLIPSNIYYWVTERFIIFFLDQNSLKDKYDLALTIKIQKGIEKRTGHRLIYARWSYDRPA